MNTINSETGTSISVLELFFIDFERTIKNLESESLSLISPVYVTLVPFFGSRVCSSAYDKQNIGYFLNLYFFVIFEY